MHAYKYCKPVCKISGGPCKYDPIPWPAKLGQTVNPSFPATDLEANQTFLMKEP